MLIKRDVLPGTPLKPLLPFQTLPRVLCPCRRRRPNSIIRQQPQACWKSQPPSRVSQISPRRRPSAATFASPGSRHPCPLPVYFSVLAPRACFLGLELLLLLFHVVVHQNTQSRDLHSFLTFFCFRLYLLVARACGLLSFVLTSEYARVLRRTKQERT